MKLHRESRYKILAIASSLGLIAAAASPILSPVEAVGFAETMVRFDRITTSTSTGGRVCANPSVANSSSTEAEVVVTFPTGFTVNATAGNWTVNTSNLDAGQTAWPGINTATEVDGQSVTFPSGNLTNGTLYCFNFASTGALTTPGSTGNNLSGTVTTYATGSVEIDSSEFATSVISDDQIVINASVGATFTFALDGNTDSFAGNLDPSSVNSTSGRTATITTNAAQGWIVWASNSNNNGSGVGSLFSTSANKHIAGAATVGTASRLFSSGSEDYGLAVTANDAAGGGTVTVDAAYDGSTTNYAGTLDPAAYQPIASSNGTADEDVLTLVERATIDNGTPAAGDYSDTITVIGAGQF